MALAETAKLVASLELQDKFSKTVAKANAGIGQLEGRFGDLGNTARRGVATAATNLTRIGVVAAGAIGVAVKQGIDSLIELEKVNAGTESALRASGLASTVSAAQIREWANAVETATGAAIDDKAIQDATNILIRLGDIAADNIQPAMAVVTDLGAAMKTDTVSAAKQLAKALADPTKAAGRLSRAGVTLTKEQQKLIETFVEAGDKAGAQRVILDALAKTTAGAAAATQGPYQRALSLLADAAEDAKMALAEGFLPVITRVAEKLNGILSDPRALEQIRSFGRTLADAFDGLLLAVERLPWAQIGDSLKLAGAGAKAVLGAFTALPPWVQTAVLTGWGLNKLTGGALSSIVGELGKGLIKGVLGIQALNVTVMGKTVTFPGGGGLPGGAKGGLPGGAAPVAAAGGIGAAGLGTLAAGIGGVLAMYLIPYLTKGPQGSSGPTLETNRNPAFATTAVLNSLAQQMTATARETAGVREKVSTVSADIRNGFAVQATALRNGFTTVATGGSRTVAEIRNGFNVNAQKTAALASTIRSGDDGTNSRLSSLNAAVNRTTSTLAAKNFSPRVTVPVTVTTNVSVRAVTQKQRTVARYTGGTSTGYTIR